MSNNKGGGGRSYHRGSGGSDDRGSSYRPSSNYDDYKYSSRSSPPPASYHDNDHEDIDRSQQRRNDHRRRDRSRSRSRSPENPYRPSSAAVAGGTSEMGMGRGTFRHRDGAGGPIGRSLDNNSSNKESSRDVSSRAQQPQNKKKRYLDEEHEKQERFEEERRARMARLREEMKREDMEMAAFQKDSQNQQHLNGSEKNLEPTENIFQVDPEQFEGLSEEEHMMKVLGFAGGFGSTKGTAVADNQTSAARGVAAKNKARKYRQYMNRKNGFNRPLDKMD